MNEDDFKRLYLQSWLMPTMSQEEYEATRGCPNRAPDCTCCGVFCPVVLERQYRARLHDQSRRDWRGRRRRTWL